MDLIMLLIILIFFGYKSQYIVQSMTKRLKKAAPNNVSLKTITFKLTFLLDLLDYFSEPRDKLVIFNEIIIPFSCRKGYYSVLCYMHS